MGFRLFRTTLISNFFLASVLLSILPFSHASTIVSAEAGRVSDTVITSREVVIDHMIEAALFKTTSKKSLPKPTIQLDKIRTREFIQETTGLLLQTAIFLEAENFTQNSEASNLAIENQRDLARVRLKNNKYWQSLQVSDAELLKFIKRKIRAKDFLRFKMDSAAIPISDREAREYYNNNPLQFENRPFESFRENIKSYLVKQQKDRRLKDWFELLQSKYRVRNFLTRS